MRRIAILDWFTGITDRIFFATAAILGMQIPGFIVQYAQRLGGHLDEARRQLKNYRAIADERFSGDINRLILEYRDSANATFSRTGEILQELVQRVDYLQASLDTLSNASLAQQIGHLIMYLDQEIAQATLRAFEFTVPLTVEAVACAIITGAVASAMFHLILLLLKALFAAYFTRRNKTA